MNDKKLYLKKAEEYLYSSLQVSETDDEQVKAKTLRAISEVQSALEIIRKREQKKARYDSLEDEDIWMG